MKARTFLLVLLLAALAAPANAGSAWVDNADGTWSLVETHSVRRLVLACARFALAPEPMLCDTAAVAAGHCADTALGTLTPRPAPQLCREADVPARCTAEQVANGATWLPDLVRCGDGTFRGASGVAPDLDYDKFPGNKVSDAPIYADICKPRWRARQWWVPSWNHCRVILRRLSVDRFGRAITSRRGGEVRILRQGDEIAEETVE